MKQHCPPFIATTLFQRSQLTVPNVMFSSHANKQQSFTAGNTRCSSGWVLGHLDHPRAFPWSLSRAFLIALSQLSLSLRHTIVIFASTPSITVVSFGIHH